MLRTTPRTLTGPTTHGGAMEALKRAAASLALEEVASGMHLGLGTGSTVAHFLDLLAERLRTGALADIVGVPTSERTQEEATRLGIPLCRLIDAGTLDLTVDGADEVGPGLNLIKGLGGALLREKIVASASRRVVIIADEGKRVRSLGERSPLPVEVVPFAWEIHDPFLRNLGAVPSLRTGEDGSPYRTDNGNYIVDCRFEGGMANPEGVEAALRGRVGIVESGLFLDIADLAVIGSDSGAYSIGREST